MLNSFIQQNTSRLIILILIMVLNAAKANAQAPILKPAAYVVKFEMYAPYNYNPFSDADPYKVKQYIGLYKGDRTNLFPYIGEQTGFSAVEYFFNEEQRPGKIMAYYELDSMKFGWMQNPECGMGSLNFEGECENGYYLIEDGRRLLLGTPDFIDLQYPVMDTTIVNLATGCTLRIRVNSASDDNLNLPSHDQISIKVDNPDPTYAWEYQVLDPSGNGTWAPLPSAVFQSSSSMQLTGATLFGSSWMSYLNKTVLFRLKKVVSGQTFTSNVLVYTHRLSSPRISDVTITPNRCYGRDSASVNVKFNRPLYSGETINIFMKDSATGADFSALNLIASNLNAQNTYTWTKELIRGTYRMSLIGKYNTMATYTGSVDHFASVKIIDPPQLKLQTKQTAALCFDGSSGGVIVRAKGGVGNYRYQVTDTLGVGLQWLNMSSPQLQTDGYYEYKHGGLPAGYYGIKLRDGNDCKLLDSLGHEQFLVQRVTQPAQPIHIPYYVVSPVTGNNATDGKITIRLAGGTPFPAPELPGLHKKYEFEWRDSSTNQLITNYSIDTTGKYETSVQQLPAGTYRFIAWDRNYDISATGNQQGCRIDIYIKLANPDPLSVSIGAFEKITCSDSANGKLKAFAAGGIPVNDSVRFNFTWYRVSGGVYTNLNTNDSILSNQPAGIYYVEIRDKYNYLKGSSLFTFTAPSPLAAIAASSSSSCYFTNNGSMSVNVSGGVAPYRYEWSNGALTPTVSGVAGGTYYVVIRDSNMCQLTKQVIVTSPNKITTNITTTPVKCYGSATGAISITSTGGTGSFTRLWNTGSTKSSVSNLPAGKYWYRVTDANGCYDTDTIQLDEPELYFVNAGADRKICTNQLITLSPTVSVTNAPIAVKWITPYGVRDSFSIRTSVTGNYIVQATNSTGCVLTDTIVVTGQNATVNTNFTVSTQAFAGENTTLVNISPLYQDSVKWILPSNMSHQLISQSKSYCELKIADTGLFKIGMIAYYTNGCIDEVYKQVNVVRSMGLTNLGSQADAFLKQFTVLPNPTTGSFTLNLLFNSVTQARVRIVNILTNVSIDTKLLTSSASYSEQYNISGQPAGTYIIIVETAKGSFIHKLNKL